MLLVDTCGLLYRTNPARPIRRRNPRIRHKSNGLVNNRVCSRIETGQKDTSFQLKKTNLSNQNIVSAFNRN